MTDMKLEHKKVMILLKAFINAANTHHLNWFVDGGTLLGTIRDSKFIPWDDDADIMMPRKDYDEFLSIYEKYHGRNFDDKFIMLQTPNTDSTYFNVHARMRLDDTCNISEREVKLKSHKGIFIDIYPIDAIPNDDELKTYLIGYMRTFRYTSLDGNNKYIDKRAAFKVMNQVLSDISRQNSNSEYVGEAIFWRYRNYMHNKMHRHCFESYILKDFEDIKVRVPSGYEEILELWYGADWKIPKKESAMHTSFIDPKNSWHKYDGKNWNELMK